MAYELESSLLVPASPMTVYRLVSDVTRTGEWSEQTYLVQWDGDDHGEGATFTGHNRTPDREWSTISTVVTALPGEEFAWSVGDAGVIWGYRMRPSPEGTMLTEFTRFGPRAEVVFSQRFGEDAARQIEIRRQAAVGGMPVTLSRISELLASQRCPAGRPRITP